MFIVCTNSSKCLCLCPDLNTRPRCEVLRQGGTMFCQGHECRGKKLQIFGNSQCQTASSVQFTWGATACSLLRFAGAYHHYHHTSCFYVVRNFNAFETCSALPRKANWAQNAEKSGRNAARSLVESLFQVFRSLGCMQPLSFFIIFKAFGQFLIWFPWVGAAMGPRLPGSQNLKMACTSFMGIQKLDVGFVIFKISFCLMDCLL